MQKRRYAGLFAGILSVMIAAGVTGCGSTKEPLDVTNLQIEESGAVVHTIIEDFDTTVYDVAGLETMISEEITAYESENAATDSITLVSSVMSETEANKLTVTMQFADAKTYAGFNNVETFYGTVTEAKEAGYDLEALTFTDTSDDGKTVSLAEIKDADTLHVFISNEKIPVRLSKKILYTFGNVELFDKYTVSNLPDAEGTTAETDGLYYVITK